MENNHDKILSVLNENYSLSFIMLELLRDGGNKTYATYSGGQKYFLKIVGRAFFNTVKESVDIQLFLQNQGFPVPHIIVTKDNSAFVHVQNKTETNLYLLYEFLECEEINSYKDAEKIGELLGRLHSTMSNYHGVLIKHERYFYIDRYIHILRKKNYQKTDLFVRYGEELWERIVDLPQSFCHGDMYSGNILKTTEGVMYITDFDTSCKGFPMYDIALICNQTDYFEHKDDGYDKTKAVYERFLPQYLKHKELSEKDIDSFYDMIALYHFTLQATIIEIYGLDCIDNRFLDKQLDWLMKWKTQCENRC